MNTKIMFFFIGISIFLTGCTAQLRQGDIVFNFCDIEENAYLICSTIALNANTIDMTLETTSSAVASVDNVIFELPDEGKYCSTDATTMTTLDNEKYTIALPCDLSAYSGQNTQLAYTATITLADGSTTSINGQAEDWVEN